MHNDQLARIVEALSQEPEEDYTLQQVVTEAVKNIPGCTMCSVFLRHGSSVEIAASTDPTAKHVDELQFEMDQGPCLSVLSEQEIALVRDTQNEPRWPLWAGSASELGLRSSLSVRLDYSAPRLASLNMYSDSVDGFDQDAIDRALVYARLASVSLGLAREITGLRSALQNRLVIGAAQGILMERYGLSLNRAFEVLRRRSNETNTKLYEVAQTVLDGGDVLAAS